MNQVEMALQLATKAHKGQHDKAGKDYIEHPKAVATMLESQEEKIVAYLHDVVEDTYVTLEDLKKMGFSDKVISAIDAITKRDNEDHEEYIKRVSANDLAKKVKLCDMYHNSDITRYDNPSLEEEKRCAKYLKKIEELSKM